MNLKKLQPRIARAVVLLLAAGFIQIGISAPAANAAAPIKPTITSVTSDAGTITVNLATTGIDATEWRWSLTRRQTFGCDNSYTDGWVNSTNTLTSSIQILGTTEGCRYLIKVAGYNGVIGTYAEYDEIAGGASNGLNIFIKTESGASTGMTRTPLNKNSNGICNTLLGRVNNIDIDYGVSGPSSCPVDGFTSYYVGYIKAPYTGTVNFKSSNDDGFILNIQGQNVIQAMSDGAASLYNGSGSISMVANEIYRIEAWHHENASGSSVRLYWDWSGQGTVIVPQSSLATDPTVFFGTCPLGSTSQCAASSAMEIKRATGTNMDGNYWIMVNGVPTLTYCIMNSAMSGGGWMLAMKGKETGSDFDYPDPRWTNTALLNETYPERWKNEDTTRNVDAKYGVYAYAKSNQIMALFPEQTGFAGGAIAAGTTGNTSVAYGFSWIETTTAMRPWTSYNAGAVNGNPAGWGGNSWNVAFTDGPTATPTCVNSATTLTNLFSTASRCAFRQVQYTYNASESPYSAIGNDLFYSQNRIRFFGINYGSSGTSNRDRARFGFGWNENGEGEEQSSDGTSGIGIDRQGYPLITTGSINNCCDQEASGLGQTGLSGPPVSSINFAFEMYVRNSVTGTINGNNLRVVSKRINSLTAANGYNVSGSNGSNTFRLSPIREGFYINPANGVITVSEQIAVGDYSMSVTSTDTDGVTGVRAITVQVLNESRETDTALSFNGTNQYSATSGTYGLWGDQTHEAWVKPATSCSQTSGNATAFGNSNLAIFCYDSYWYVSFYSNANAWASKKTSMRVVSGQWVHIAVVRSGTTVTAYFNNSQASFWNGTSWDSSYQQATVKNDYSIHLVGGSGSPGQYFNGSVDEMKVWASARTLSEIWSGAHTQENVSQPSLWMYWDFNEGTGSAISRAQLVDNNFNLTPNSSTQWTPIAETSNSGPYTIVTVSRTLISVNPGWVAPSGISRISALLVGGGGGGGGGGYATTPAAGGGGGGGSGGTLSQAITVSANTRYPIRVGGFGLGGVAGSSGSWNGGYGSSGDTTSAFSFNVSGGFGGWGAGWNTSSTWSDGTGGIGGASGNSFAGGAKSTNAPSGGGGGGGATSAGTAASGTTTGAAGGAGLSSPITTVSTTYAVGGSGGSGTSTSSVAGAEGTYATSTSGGGGGGGGGAISALPGMGGAGSSGILIFRYLNATKPSFTNPTNTTINVGMTETFSVNVLADSVTANMTRTFRWESSTTGSNGSFSLIKQGTGVANTSFSWVPPDTTTSGNQFVYRVIVTDSDTLGLSYTETSSAVFATINGRLVLNGKSAVSKTVNISKTETFTVTGGTSTFRYALLPDGPNFWLDTSTAGSPRLRMLDTATVGTYYETLTVTDSLSATSVIPLTIKVSPPPSFSANAEQVDSGTVLYLDAGNTSSYAGTGNTWTDISGLARHASMNASLSNTQYVSTTQTTCKAPAYSSDNVGVLNFSNASNNKTCAITPNLGILNTYTVQTWFRISEPQAIWSAMLSNPYSGTGKQLNFALFWTGSTNLSAGVFDGTDWFYTDGLDIPLNTWALATITFDGNYVTLYIDRNGVSQSSIVKDATARRAFTTASLNTVLAIGRRWDGDDYFSGSMGSIRIYDRVLSPVEISQNYNVTKGRFLGTQNKQAQSGKYGVRFSDTYTVTAGSETITAAWSNSSLTRVIWDTSTARSLVLSSQESLTPGTYYDTITVTDTYGSLTRLPLTYTIAKADTVTVWIETPTALNYTGTNAVFTPVIRTSGLVSSDTGTALVAIKYRPGGTSCATGGVCNVGDIGPGGGIVFITPSTAGGNGKYFEAAPFNWAGTDELGTAATYCSNGNLNLGATNVGIGWGETNTNLAKAACLGGAVAKVNSFNLANNTGYSDWFIPSSNEMIELAKVRTSAGLLQLGSNWTVGRYGYWSSTEASASVQASLVTSSWSMGGTGKSDASNNLVRPVRAFTPCWSVNRCATLASTSKPTDAGTYAITGETLTLSTGDLSNYVAVKYETSTVTINRIAQSVQQGVIYNAAHPDVFNLLMLSGNGNGAVSYSISSGGTAGTCATDYKKISAASVGTCNVQIVRLGDRNYLSDTSTAYVYFMTFVINQPAPAVGSGATIALTGETSIIRDPNVAPTITSVAFVQGYRTLHPGGLGFIDLADHWEITGAGFGAAQNSETIVKFWRNQVATTGAVGSDAVVFNDNTIVIFRLPTYATTGKITVTTANGIAVSTDNWVAP